MRYFFTQKLSWNNINRVRICRARITKNSHWIYDRSLVSPYELYVDGVRAYAQILRCLHIHFLNFITISLDGTSVLTHFSPADTYTAQVNVEEVTRA